MAFASSRDNGLTIHILDMATHEVSQLTRPPNLTIIPASLLPDHRHPVWSPNGHEIVYLSGYGYVIYIVDIETGVSRYVAPAFWNSVPIWRPDPSAAGNPSP